MRTRKSTALASVRALNLAPLGWAHGRVLYLAAHATDSSVYAVTAHTVRFLSILATQPITSGALSPDCRWIAFAVPASCFYCTLDLFNVENRSLWSGPSGVQSETSIAWTDDSRSVVAQQSRGLIRISPVSHDAESYSAPRGLPAVWSHPMRATLQGTSLLLVDRTTGRMYHPTITRTG
jgi:hypothetical protein